MAAYFFAISSQRVAGNGNYMFLFLLSVTVSFLFICKTVTVTVTINFCHNTVLSFNFELYQVKYKT